MSTCDMHLGAFVVEYPAEGYMEFDNIDDARRRYEEIEVRDGELKYMFRDIRRCYGDEEDGGDCEYWGQVGLACESRIDGLVALPSRRRLF